MTESGLSQMLELARDPQEADCRTRLRSWFVVEEAIVEYFEQVEEEGVYPDRYGKSVVASSVQYPGVFQLISRLAKFLQLEPPPCFVHKGYAHVCESEGLHTPRLEVSARAMRNFSELELTHALAKEMYHIKVGHIREQVMAKKMLALLRTIPGLPGLSVVRQFGGSTVLDVVGFTLREAAFSWFKHSCFSAENFAVAYTDNLQASLDATLMTVLNDRGLVESTSVPAYLEQISDIEACQGPMATLAKLNEVLPYGPYRVMNMLRFRMSAAGQELASLCADRKAA